MNKFLLAALLVAFSNAALAESASSKYDSGFYVVGGFGAVTGSGNGRSNAWNIGGGYDINQYSAVEISYADYWRRGFSSWSTAGLVPANDTADGLKIGLIGKLPINDSFKLLAGLDYLSLSRKLIGVNAAGNPASGSATVGVMGYELGAEMQFDMRTSLRATYFQTQSFTMPANFPSSNGAKKLSGVFFGVVARF